MQHYVVCSGDSLLCESVGCDCECECVCLLERLPATLPIRNPLATHCETILLRYFVAVNNALVYLLSGEAWQEEGEEGEGEWEQQEVCAALIMTTRLLPGIKCCSMSDLLRQQLKLLLDDVAAVAATPAYPNCCCCCRAAAAAPAVAGTCRKCV